MYIYRIMDKGRFFDGSISNFQPSEPNVNTFEYDGEEYIHFFVLPEQAGIYKKMFYDEKGLKSLTLQFSVPEYMLKDNFGVGMYRCKEDSMMVPFLEVRLKKKDLDREMIEEISSEMMDSWLDKDVYKQYSKDIEKIEGEKSPILLDITKNLIDQTEVNPKLNPNFNFFKYFPGTPECENNIKEENYNNSKIRKLSKSLINEVKKIFNKSAKR